MKVGKFSARSSQQIEGAKYVKKMEIWLHFLTSL